MFRVTDRPDMTIVVYNSTTTAFISRKKFMLSIYKREMSMIFLYPRGLDYRPWEFRKSLKDKWLLSKFAFFPVLEPVEIAADFWYNSSFC